MNQIFKELEEKRKALQEKIKDIERAIKSLRALCEHEWKNAGSDSHHDYEVCQKCGESRRV
jgi:predicted  nucleic acid-binding Zn-ribbon protein